MSDKDSLDEEERNPEATFVVQREPTKVGPAARQPHRAFADSGPMPTPNRALMSATGDSFSPIGRVQQRAHALPGPSLTSMLALEKRDAERQEPHKPAPLSPRTHSDSGNSNGSEGGEGGAVCAPLGPVRVLFDYLPIDDDEIPLTKGRRARPADACRRGGGGAARPRRAGLVLRREGRPEGLGAGRLRVRDLSCWRAGAH